MQNIGVRREMNLRSVSLATGVLEGSTEGVDHQFCNKYTTAPSPVWSTDQRRVTVFIQFNNFQCIYLLSRFTYRKFIECKF